MTTVEELKLLIREKINYRVEGNIQSTENYDGFSFHEDLDINLNVIKRFEKELNINFERNPIIVHGWKGLITAHWINNDGNLETIITDGSGETTEELLFKIITTINPKILINNHKSDGE